MVGLGRHVAMTAIKTKAVTSAGHVGNLGKYLNDDRALLRDSQHIVNDRRWEKEMDATREAYGHNDPSRAGAKVTYMYHQVIGFNPDECSCNDGKMTPEKCMDFAREWVRNRYPSQEAVWVLHQEHCNADGTDRYAVHIGINRTDLETGKRLCEGRGQKAKVERANAMRRQDGRWGLRQMAKGERNSRVHAMQPTRAEKAMRARGVQPDKAYIRQHVRQHVREISRGDAPGNRMRELSRRLEADGIKMSMSKGGKQVKFQREGSGFEVGGSRLGRGFSMSGIAKGLGMEAGLQVARGVSQDMDR